MPQALRHRRNRNSILSVGKIVIATQHANPFVFTLDTTNNGSNDRHSITEEFNAYLEVCNLMLYTT